MKIKVYKIISTVVIILYILICIITNYIHWHEYQLNGANTKGYFDQQYGNKPVAKVRKSAKILCFIPATEATLYKRAVHVNATWIKRCDKALFFTKSTNNKFPTIGLNITEKGRYSLTSKMMRILDYLAEKHLNEFDWFLKADDDTYVVVENLRHFLRDKDPDQNLFYGQRFESEAGNIYLSGGAGYTISRNALKMFQQNDCFIAETGAEDIDIGNCFRYLGIKATHAVDELGRVLFHSTRPVEIVANLNPVWYFALQKHWTQGVSGISNRSISFHFVEPFRMYEIEFLLYGIKVFRDT